MYAINPKGVWFMNFSIKYGCYCINCEQRTEEGECSITYLSCDFNNKEGKCPVTKCMSFKIKSAPTQSPCQYYYRLENSGLSNLRSVSQ